MEKGEFMVFEVRKIKKEGLVMWVIMRIVFDRIEKKIVWERWVGGMVMFEEYGESEWIKERFWGGEIDCRVGLC